MEVLRRCPLATAQRLVHCAIAVSTAVFGQSHKGDVRCTAVDKQLGQLEAKEVHLSQPSSTSLLTISWSFDLAWNLHSSQDELRFFIWTLVERIISIWASALHNFGRTHCVLVVCDSEAVTIALRRAFWIPTQVAAALISCYVAGATWNCCCLGASSVYTIRPCTSL